MQRYWSSLQYSFLRTLFLLAANLRHKGRHGLTSAVALIARWRHGGTAARRRGGAAARRRGGAAARRRGVMCPRRAAHHASAICELSIIHK